MDVTMEKKEATTGTEVVVSGFADYRKYKAELDGELTRAAQSFVRIGFLLRVAEDTDILKGSGYRNVTEFAAAEYGLDKSQVSRFININIRFSENGYSDHLQERYEGFGYAKLAVMLSLPEEINAELPGSLSKADIQEVAEEVRAEAEISEIELAIEKAEAAPVQPEGRDASLLHRAAAQLCREQQDLFRKLWMEQGSLENMQEILAPFGESVFMVRIPGTGRLMITVRDQDTGITVVRTGEKEHCSTEAFTAEIWNICRKGMTPEEAFLTEFGKEMEKPAEAPSGQDPRQAAAVEKKEPKQRRASRVTKARIPEPEPAAVMEEPLAAAVPEVEQLPGQMDVNDFSEILPGETRGEDHGAETRETACGEGTAADGEMGSGTGEADGEQAPGLPVCNGIPETEEEAWMEARRAEDALRQYFAVWDGREQYMPVDLVQSVYRTAIDLAAAMEKVMIRRGRDHEQEHHA